MSDTISDVLVSKDVYVDINTLSGIVAGTAVVIANKSTTRVRLQVASSQPSANSVDGEILYPGGHVDAIKIVTSGENTVWAKSFDNVAGSISVQENT